MRIQLESIQPDANSSFRLLRNPRLSDLFYWHFHPEYELVYIEGANGPRHVGEHLSHYEGSDLVFIGTNIPHLNFDYGVKTDYEKVVLQIQPQFLSGYGQSFPELADISELFIQAQHGLAFSGKTKKDIGQRLKDFHRLAPFEQFVEVLSIFHILAQSEECIQLHDQPYINPFKQKEQERLRRIYAFIDQHYQEKIEVATIASLSNLGKEAFCRYFKRATGMTFITFLNQYRISQAKRLLLKGHSITEACYESGFESLSYFTRTFKKVAQENPRAFQQRHH